jgi:hypothetical protein
MSRNPVGDFNAQGQEKCVDCGNYYPEAWGAHGRTCPNAPKEDDD